MTSELAATLGDSPFAVLKWLTIGALCGGGLVGIVWMGIASREQPVISSPTPTSITAESRLRDVPRPNGVLGKPFGTVVTIRGVVFDTNRKAEQGILWLDVRTIDGLALEAPVSIPLNPYLGEWGSTWSNGKRLPKLVMGGSYELRGYEDGGFTGIPDDAYKLAGVPLATTGFGFRHVFIVISGGEIDPLPLKPGDQ